MLGEKLSLGQPSHRSKASVCKLLDTKRENSASRRIRFSSIRMAPITIAFTQLAKTAISQGHPKKWSAPTTERSLPPRFNEVHR
jgi:hypothetical protein